MMLDGLGEDKVYPASFRIEPTTDRPSVLLCAMMRLETT